MSETDALKKRAHALEEGYFKKLSDQALKDLSAKTSSKKSPITGEPMVQVMCQGVEIDVCPESGGIWLDQGELDKIIENSIQKEEKGVFHSFWEKLGL